MEDSATFRTCQRGSSDSAHYEHGKFKYFIGDTNVSIRNDVAGYVDSPGNSEMLTHFQF